MITSTETLQNFTTKTNSIFVEIFVKYFTLFFLSNFVIISNWMVTIFEPILIRKVLQIHSKR